MKIVIDGMASEPGTSVAVIVEHFLRGWAELGTDEVHIFLAPNHSIPIPDSVIVEPVRFGPSTGLSRVREQTFGIPRLCRSIGADGLVGILPSTSIAPLPCPRAIITHDLRWEILPHQYPFVTRMIRRASYAIGWHQADAIACITERTRKDLVAPRPWLNFRRVQVAHYGSDHVATWKPEPTEESYAIAFGQFGNKNVDMVLDAWALLRDQGATMPLRLIGMSEGARAAADAQIERLKLTDLVTPIGWLHGDELRRCFSSASLFVFPSAFEGFGLPAIEAMRIGIPLVISPEPALLEITGGKATVMDGWGPVPLAAAVVQALKSTPGQLDAARHRAEEFSWAGMAATIRSMLIEASAQRSPR